MIVSIVGGSCYVYRQPGDPVFRPNRSRYSWSPPGWYGAESRLLYNVGKMLTCQGTAEPTTPTSEPLTDDTP
jgi:hypothetical protein